MQLRGGDDVLRLRSGQVGDDFIRLQINLRRDFASLKKIKRTSVFVKTSTRQVKTLAKKINAA